MGKKTKAFVKDLLNTIKGELYIHTIKDKQEKYGRYLGEIYAINFENKSAICINFEIWKYCKENFGINITEDKSEIYTPLINFTFMN